MLFTPFAEIALDDVRPLLQILWNLLPYEYTYKGGVSFDQWVSGSDSPPTHRRAVANTNGRE